MTTGIRFHKPTLVAITVAVAGWLAPGAVDAQDENEFDLSISAGVSYSDNITRTEGNEQSETSPEIGLTVTIVQARPKLTVNLASDLAYRTYLDNTYDSEMLGGLDGSVVYAFSPERFTWTVQDNFGQSFIDPTQSETPDNRQNTNYFSTGPDFYLPLGSRTTLLLQGRWSDVSYESGGFDNRRYSGMLGLSRSLSETSSVSLHGTAQRVEYDGSTVSNAYDTQSGYLHYGTEGARTSLSVRAGYTALHDGGETSDGPLFGLSLTRQVSARSTLGLDAGTEYTDAAEAFRRDQQIGGVTVGNENTVVSSDSFQSDYVTAGWTLDGERNSIQIGVDWRKEEHDFNLEFDRERLGGNMTLTRKISERFSANLSGDYYSVDFVKTGLKFDEWTAGLGFGWDFGPGLSVSLNGGHYVRTSGEARANAGAYTENRISLRFAYSPGS